VFLHCIRVRASGTFPRVPLTFLSTISKWEVYVEERRLMTLRVKGNRVQQLGDTSLRPPSSVSISFTDT
jgi:hypothetical protein